MIFFLASLPNNSFKAAENIFKLYAEGKLKDQSISRSKKGINSIPDLKGSTFKSFRGLDPSVVHQLLTEISSKKCSLREATVQCDDIKALQKVQGAFVKVTNCTSWEDAVNKHPNFTTPQKLEPFKKLDFTKTKLPEKFLWFCKQIKDTVSIPAAVDETISQEEYDDYFLISHQTSLGLLWKQNALDINPDNFQKSLKLMNVHSFGGFQFSIIDFDDGQPTTALNYCNEVAI